jgi:dCTP deaminase
MILSDHEILTEIADKEGIKPYLPELLNPSAYEVRLGRYLTTEHGEKIDLCHVDTYTLNPGEFLIAQTIETFKLPTLITAQFKIRETLVKQGLLGESTVTKEALHSGGYLTFALKNYSQHTPIVLDHGMKVGKLTFMWLGDTPDNSLEVR